MQMFEQWFCSGFLDCYTPSNHCINHSSYHKQLQRNQMLHASDQTSNNSIVYTACELMAILCWIYYALATTLINTAVYFQSSTTSIFFFNIVLLECYSVAPLSVCHRDSKWLLRMTHFGCLLVSEDLRVDSVELQDEFIHDFCVQSRVMFEEGAVLCELLTKTVCRCKRRR